MENKLDIRFGVDVTGFENKLICGTINFFDGWAANTDLANPVKSIIFIAGPYELGTLPLQKDRPDLEKMFKRRKLGFSGVVDIPRDCIGMNLILVAETKDGKRMKIGEYPLSEQLSEESLAYRKNNKLPEDILQHLVVQNINPQLFLELGKSAVELITQVLDRHQIALDNLKNILDFGVGCGRVMRWWSKWSNRINFYGTDINPLLIEWCQNNFDFGKYSVNPLRPPSEFKDKQFDLIYLFSVFTHLTIEKQREWLREFSRILAPGKYLLVSVHGDLHAKYLPEEAFTVYKSSGYYIMNQDLEGQNICATYQNKEFSEKLFSPYFVILDYLPQALTACGGQDLFLLQKKA